MYFIGVDLHKRTLSVCVLTIDEGKRRFVARQTFGESYCQMLWTASF
jgi:hypothetical protein